MQVDLALFLRLSRSLESAGGALVASGDVELGILSALDGLLLALGERRELVRIQSVAVENGLGVQVEAISTEAVPPLSREEAPSIPERESTDEQEVVAEWNAIHDRLYEDLLWLFRIGDNEGALISLGRLANLAYGTEELQRFLEINEPKLVGLYEKILGDFSAPYVVLADGLGDRYFYNPEEASQVLGLAIDFGDVKTLLDCCPLPRIRTLSLLHRLQSERMLQMGDGPQRAGVQ